MSPGAMRRALAAAAVALACAGCAVAPRPIGEAEHAGRVQQERATLFDGQDAPSGPLTLADAVARALRHNAEHRVRLMEEAQAQSQADLSRLDTWPRLTAAAGYHWRDSDAFGYGFSPSGSVGTSPSAATERIRSVDSLTFSWNLLDFGMSYFRARQSADQVLVAAERRRKAEQNLVADVSAAWWRAEAAQRLLPQLDALQAELQRMAARARLIEARKLMPPVQAASYRRSLTDIEQPLSARRAELLQAQSELAWLVHAAPGLQPLVVAASAGERVVRDLTADVAALERTALQQRPELREEGYRARLTAIEGDRQLAALLPSLGLELGPSGDSNRYLLDPRWTAASVNLSWNLLRLFAWPEVRAANDAAQRVDDARRRATMAAVIAQTRLAAMRYRLAAQEVEVTRQAMSDDEAIVAHLAGAREAGIDGDLELFRARARAVVTRVQFELAWAGLQTALARLFHTLGLDLAPTLVDGVEPGTALAAGFVERVGAWQAQTLGPVARPTMRLTLRLAPLGAAAEVGDTGGVAGRMSSADAEAVRSGLRDALSAVDGVEVTEDATAMERVESRVDAVGVEGARRRVALSLRRFDAQGQLQQEVRHVTTLVDPIDPRQWAALGEAAGYRMADAWTAGVRVPASNPGTMR